MRRHERSLVRVLRENLGEDVKYGIEVGVWKGGLSAALLRSFPDLRTDNGLWLGMVDLWGVPEGKASMHDKDNNEEAMQQAKQVAIEATKFAENRRMLFQDDSIHAAAQWEDCGLDFVFVDADHYYESVKADVEAWWPKVRKDGILAGHDYNGQGDRRKGWGVKRATDEFIGALGLKVNVEPGLVWWVKKES